ncbi:hypothetical protein D3C75_678960 [compost metagenome]
MGAAGVADHHLQLAFQVLEGQLAAQAVQAVFGVGDGDELHRAQFGAQVAADAVAADGQVGDAFVHHFLDARQHFFTQAYPAATALRHERGQGAYQAGTGVGGIDHQAYLGLPALFHVVGKVFELAGLLDQVARTAQQDIAGLGEHRLAAVDAQQRHAKLLLHAGHGVADR